MAKKKAKETAQETEADILDKPAKQTYAKITSNKKANKRTWVVIYRLVDGPPVDMELVKKAAERREKAARKAGKKDS